MPDKLDKSVVLYMPAADINRYRGALPPGAACGRCMMFLTDISGCSIVHQNKDQTVSGPKGVCGLFVGGEPMTSKTMPPHPLVTRKVAGYIEGDMVPTHCGSCEYWGGGFKDKGPCQKVEGTVEYYGCCNAYEQKSLASFVPIKDYPSR